MFERQGSIGIVSNVCSQGPPLTPLYTGSIVADNLVCHLIASGSIRASFQVFVTGICSVRATSYASIRFTSFQSRKNITGQEVLHAQAVL